MISGAKWDWYQATVERSEGVVKWGIIDAIDGEWRPKERKLHGYASAWDFFERGTGQLLMSCLSGGHNPHPHLVSTGPEANEAADVIRKAFPEHFVARADACYDFDQVGMFDRCIPILVDLCERKGVKNGVLGDWFIEKARTMTVGSKKSEVIMNMYEKGAQLLQQKGFNPEGISPDFVRFEVRVRPSKRMIKGALAQCSADDMWTLATWAREVREQCMDISTPRYELPRRWRDENLERTAYHLFSQYGKFFKTVKEAKEMTWAGLGEWIGDNVEKR